MTMQELVPIPRVIGGMGVERLLLHALRTLDAQPDSEVPTLEWLDWRETAVMDLRVLLANIRFEG